MTPLMFGPAARRLFGLYHPAEGTQAPKGAVLICPPFGQEALRSHRFFKVMADRLARSGHSVLRMDYHATGDSPGDDAEGDLEGWSRDIAAAHDELRRLATSASGTPRVSWLGVRLGGTLAIRAAQRTRPALERLVLWEPVMDGRHYARMLREWHVHSLEISYCIPDPSLRRRLATDPLAFIEEASGFAVSPLLRRQLETLRPEDLRLAENGCGPIVIAQPGDAALAQWAQMQQQAGRAARVSEFEHPLDWNSDPSSSHAMVPAEALRRLLAAMNE
jgi:pimeloyl-ACP methyl ester carboxylesterase